MINASVWFEYHRITHCTTWIWLLTSQKNTSIYQECWMLKVLLLLINFVVLFVICRCLSRRICPVWNCLCTTFSYSTLHCIMHWCCYVLFEPRKPEWKLVETSNSVNLFFVTRVTVSPICLQKGQRSMSYEPVETSNPRISAVALMNNKICIGHVDSRF